MGNVDVRDYSVLGLSAKPPVEYLVGVGGAISVSDHQVKVSDSHAKQDQIGNDEAALHQPRGAAIMRATASQLPPHDAAILLSVPRPAQAHPAKAMRDQPRWIAITPQTLFDTPSTVEQTALAMKAE